MSYIGAEPTTAAFPFDQFSGNGTTTAFTLTYAPASTTSIIVAISGVVQNPNLYSVIGTTITFSPAPPTGTNNISVLYLGLPVQIGTPIPGSRLELALGSAANPSLTFLGDTNTGIFSPAADTIAFSEGGVESMRIDSSGNVGIGTSSPVNKLNVVSSTGQVDNDGLIKAEYTGSTSTVNASVTVKNYGGTSQFMQWELNGLRIGSRITTNGGSGAVVFTTGNDTERARIDSSGRWTVTSQPGFMAGIAATTDATINANSLVPFNTVTATGAFNTGTNFNTSTNLFTAPIAGRYMFSFTLYTTNSGSSTQSMQAGIRINGAFVSFTSGDSYGVANAIPNSTGGVISITTSVILNLAANDTIGVAARTNALRIYQGHCFFSGFLLG